MKWPMVKFLMEAVNSVRAAIRFARMDGNNKNRLAALAPAFALMGRFACGTSRRGAVCSQFDPTGSRILAFTPWNISS
jgi:hypothetical protein